MPRAHPFNTLIPASLRAHLQSCADFAAEDATTQLRLALMLWMSLQPRRQHREYPGHATFSKEEMRAIWGSENAMYRALAGKHFHVFQRSNWDGYTLAFQPTQEMLEALHRCLADPLPSDLLDADLRPLHRFPKAIAPFRAYAATRATEWAGARPSNKVPINESELMAYWPFASPLDKQGIAALLRMSRNTIHPGCVPHRYTQYSTGRLFTGRTSLQFASRNVRAAALAGFWDYDIANCHPAIIACLAARIGLPSPVLDHYIANKDAIRQRIADEAGITAKQAKQCLLMVVYGAMPSTSERTAMVKMFAAQFAQEFSKTMEEAKAKETGLIAAKEAVQRLRKNPRFAAIYKEIERLRLAIIKDHTRLAGWVVNPLGLRIPATEPERVLLSHITQGYEAAALRAVVARHGESVLLCLHDGWVARHRLDVPQCEADLLAATGIPLRIEEKLLEPPPDQHRVDSADEDEYAEIPLEDQALTPDATFSHDSSSPLRGFDRSVLRRRRHEPGDGIRLSLRAQWNYLPD